MTYSPPIKTESWGRVDKPDQRTAFPSFRKDVVKALTDREQDSVLSIGLRRSYGDSTLNPEGRLIDMTHLDRVMAFDTENGILRAEAGLALQQLLRLTVPKGWFVRTTPGTRFVTLGGAVANDVHGKNHHKVGSFGNTVRCLGLERSDGSSLVLSENENPELFRATIGGLGLTGAITWVEIELEKIASAFVDVERIPFETVDAFFTLAEASGDFEHTVAWIDASSKGRGIFQQGNWSKTGGLDPHPPKIKLSMPMDFPGFTLNKWSVRAFNEVYFRKQAAGDAKFTQHYAPFFHPLDSIGTWNRMYGQRGFYQYQCVLPPEAAKEAVRELLAQISAAGAGSFLAVLKTMGTVPSRGLLSFPREGATLALDFPNLGQETVDLMGRLDAVVSEAKGRLYPAKDGRMPAAMFQAGYPGFEAFKAYVDPAFSSAFWRRVSV